MIPYGPFIHSKDRLGTGIQSVGYSTGAPNENIVQNHLKIALLNVFEYLSAGTAQREGLGGALASPPPTFLQE